jgi:hypothetical protein
LKTCPVKRVSKVPTHPHGAWGDLLPTRLSGRGCGGCGGRGRRPCEIRSGVTDAGHISFIARLAGAAVEASTAFMWHQGGFGMTPATIDLNGLDSDIRANVLRQLTASGLSEQVFVNQVYHALAGGQFSLLDLLGPNAGTLEAMQELAEGRGVTAETIEQLFVDLHADD